VKNKKDFADYDFYHYFCDNKSTIIMDAKITKIICDYLKTKPIEKAWIFGSYAMGQQTENSDVDILITFKEGTRMGLEFMAMICDLERLLGKAVDLVIDGDILPFAHENVERQKILIYERAA